MYKKRLFERVSDLHYKDSFVCTESMQIKSIIGYLKFILSMRKGTTKIDQSLGMDNIYNSHDESFETFVLNAEKELQKEIKKSEPRLKNIIVTYEGKDYNNLFYKFKIEATLVEYENKKIILSTMINSEGRVEINE
jgi:predicted component of type VI protein secretion system